MSWQASLHRYLKVLYPKAEKKVNIACYEWIINCEQIINESMRMKSNKSKSRTKYKKKHTEALLDGLEFGTVVGRSSESLRRKAVD